MHFVIITLLFLSPVSPSYINSMNEQWSVLKPGFVGELIRHMVEEQSNNCDIFYISTNSRITEDNTSGQSLHKIIKSTHTWLVSQTGIMKQKFRSNGIYHFSLDLDPNQKNVSKLKLTSFDFVHKQSSQCALVFIDFLFFQDKNGTSNNPVAYKKFNEDLVDLLTSNYGSMTRKDEDHYVLLTNRKLTTNKVLEMEFSQSLKFKMVLYERENKEISSEVSVIHSLSVCFYCEHGLPLLIDLGLRLTNLQIHSKSTIKPQTDLIFPDFTRNAWGHELQVSAQTRLVFVYSIEQRKTGDKGLRWYFKRGFGKSIVDGITLQFNYTYRVHPAQGNGGSGALLVNGTWLGSVRDIIDGTTDIGVAVALNYARYQLIGGNSFFYAWVNFIMGKPKPVYSLTALLLPFQIELWCALGISLILLIFTFKILAMKYDDDNAQGNNFNRHISSFIVFSLVEEDMIYPKTTSSRLLCGIWLLAAVIITTAYRSELVTLLTFPPLQSLPETFSQLAESDYDWGLESAAIGGAAHQHFKSSPSTVNKKIFSRMSLERDSRKCFSEPVKRNFACITWSTQGEYILHRNFTNAQARSPLVMSEDLSAIVGSGIAYKKRAIFRYNFDRLVDSIREMGMADKWKILDYDKERDDHIKWLKQQNAGRLENPNPDARGLILENLRGTFYFFIAGLSLASIVYVCELLKIQILFLVVFQIVGNELGYFWNKFIRKT